MVLQPRLLTHPNSLTRVNTTANRDTCIAERDHLEDPIGTPSSSWALLVDFLIRNLLDPSIGPYIDADVSIRLTIFAPMCKVSGITCSHVKTMQTKGHDGNHSMLPESSDVDTNTIRKTAFLKHVVMSSGRRKLDRPLLPKLLQQQSLDCSPTNHVME